MKEITVVLPNSNKLFRLIKNYNSDQKIVSYLGPNAISFYFAKGLTLI